MIFQVGLLRFLSSGFAWYASFKTCSGMLILCAVGNFRCWPEDRSAGGSTMRQFLTFGVLMRYVYLLVRIQVYALYISVGLLGDFLYIDQCSTHKFLASCCCNSLSLQRIKTTGRLIFSITCKDQRRNRFTRQDSYFFFNSAFENEICFS